MADCEAVLVIVYIFHCDFIFYSGANKTNFFPVTYEQSFEGNFEFDRISDPSYTVELLQPIQLNKLTIFICQREVICIVVL